MAQESRSETLDQSQSQPQSQSQSSVAVSSPPSRTTDPSLSRNSSLSRLNAQAPEFVPSPRTDPKHQHQQHTPTPPAAPPSPPTGMLHVYPSPFHVPMLSMHHHYQVHPHFYPEQDNSFPNQHPHPHPHPHPNKHHHHPNHHQSQSPDHNRNSLPVSDEATQKILNQVEYYFSDLNLATTDHLIRFISKDPHGYVPISVVASFKKIKALVTSHAHLSSILRHSSKLIVSEDGKKVKRQHPFTISDMEELQSRVIIAENLPEDHCHQNLMKVFSAVGSVKAIRTCQPQASTGGQSSGSRSGKGDSLPFSNKLHAFVEYESVELAEKAVDELNDEGNWRSGLRVRLMHKRGSKSVQVRTKKGSEGEEHCNEDEVSTSQLQPNEKPIEESSEEVDPYTQGHMGEENLNEGGQRKNRGRGRGKGRGRGQYHQNNRGNHAGTPPSNDHTNNEPQVAAKQPPGPRMPDGTRGFAMGRGKPVAVNTT